jgi:hypothetical protein
MEISTVPAFLKLFGYTFQYWRPEYKQNWLQFTPTKREVEEAEHHFLANFYVVRPQTIIENKLFVGKMVKDAEPKTVRVSYATRKAFANKETKTSGLIPCQARSKPKLKNNSLITKYKIICKNQKQEITKLTKTNEALTKRVQGKTFFAKS